MSLCVLERYFPSTESKVGANIGMLVLIAAVVLSFFVVKWWIALLCLPVIWLASGYTGGFLANRLHNPMLYIFACVFAASVMFYTYMM